MPESFAYHTDLDWFENIRKSTIKGEINFWITDRRIKLFPGELFFMKNQKRFIGVARVKKIENSVAIREAWDRYGKGNGASGLFSLIQNISKVLVDKSATQNGLITCIILYDFTPIIPVSFEDAGIPNFQTNKRLSEYETERLLGLI